MLHIFPSKVGASLLFLLVSSIKSLPVQVPSQPFLSLSSSSSSSFLHMILNLMKVAWEHTNFMHELFLVVKVEQQQQRPREDPLHVSTAVISSRALLLSSPQESKKRASNVISRRILGEILQTFFKTAFSP